MPIQRNFEIWRNFNPQHDFYVVDKKFANGVLELLRIDNRQLPPQVITDIVRTFLLSQYGGLWVDSTVLPVIPLDDWFTNDYTNVGFFAFRSTGDVNLVLQNWFLYSEKGNILSQRWLDIFVDYFQSRRIYPTWRRALFHFKLIDYIKYKKNIKNRNTIWFADPEKGRRCVFYPYAIHNYNFAFLLKIDAQCAELWSRVTIRCAQRPTFLGDLARDPETAEATFSSFLPELLSLSPVHKLSRSRLSYLAFEYQYNLIKKRM